MPEQALHVQPCSALVERHTRIARWLVFFAWPPMPALPPPPSPYVLHVTLAVAALSCCCCSPALLAAEAVGGLTYANTCTHMDVAAASISVAVKVMPDRLQGFDGIISRHWGVAGNYLVGGCSKGR